ncbi:MULTISPECIES: allophanate hydrolase [Pseudomonas syringae group]|uniref:Allophanate hydrolase n=1 Tax=Pseudomonas coronafaciens pv. coronafaciens TaxID=235275 RepID=A0AAE6QFA3_9PSED|nr:allophanate hydrolase [Pseudomonas coronafaciens]KPX34027.1 Allophanate hydrolase [Pseudomonas coronafaciens pv. garcae]QGT80662.1 allophanate hydrolase [Pseudomonas coronafaciens pv. coronafaciens]QIQ73465.1 Allophanate hydrolase [Pseudomonas coronafaciens]RMM86221.1 Allophanate hydrolase [Pseudomonas coronafaciens pv. striafaciens]RMS95280.1 Allophanate hydrolase [Pseudomonas coronafaciens pv. oryzae]
MNDTTLPNDLRLDTVRGAYQAGDLTPRQLILALREKAEALNPVFHLFIHLLSVDELEPYLAELESRDLKDLPLYGVPFAIKDNIDLAGIPTTAACPDYAYTPERSATVVEQLITLGAVPMGKTNLDQFATGLNGSRSPYGACPNSVLPDYPSGGSSSGSSLAVALGVSSFALGTDTAGSGRVPAALNNLLGMKASKGLISTAGVVPACRTQDCVSTFTATAREASQLLGLVARFDPRDEYSRRNPQWNDASAFGAPRPFRFGVPRAEDLEFFGCAEGPLLFGDAVNRLTALGGEAVTVNLSPFLEAARLLYEGPWVAERYSVAGPLMEERPEAVLPVIRAVLAKATAVSGVDTFRAQYRLQALKMICDQALEGLDCVLTPSIGRPVTSAELSAEPVLRNSELGYYTNFVNLLDYAAIAVPGAFMSNGLPWGVTLFGRAFTDQYLLSLADALQRQSALPLIGGEAPSLPTPTNAARNDMARLVVCGAHLDGLTLNWQLRQRGGHLLEATQSSADYRLYALAGGPPFRPGMMRVAGGGVAIAVEVWELPSAELGSFLSGIPAPLGLGKVQLTDGRWETGFICEAYGLEGSRDISHLGGWRAYLQQL